MIIEEFWGSKGSDFDTAHEPELHNFSSQSLWALMSFFQQLFEHLGRRFGSGFLLRIARHRKKRERFTSKGPRQY